MTVDGAPVIGVPTFRRPDLLARLLDSVADDARAAGALVVVGDNDCGDDAPRVVARHAERGLDVVAVPVRIPGVAEVRNELVRQATARRPDWRHLVMYDDDGIVEPGALPRLLRVAREHDADVTGGPVVGELPPGTGLLGRNSVLAARPTYPTGPVPMLNGAQNIALSRRIVDRLGDPWFSPELGRSGSEDYEFFRRVLAAGGTLAWAADAVVHEPPPAERLRALPLMRRAFHANRVNAGIDRRLDGAPAVRRRLAGGSVYVARGLAASAVRRDPDRFASTLLDAVSLAGRAAGLVRPPDTTRSRRYGG